MRIETRALIEVLTDLAETACTDLDIPGICAVQLHTARGYWGDEPGQVDLLCGSSTNRFIAGHTYTLCDGQLGGPILLALHDAKAIVDVFKASAKQKDPLHSVEIRRDGQLLVVREDPNLIDDGLSVQFSLGNLDHYPMSTYRILDRETKDAVVRSDGATEQALPRTDHTPSQLLPFVKIAKRRKMPLRIYRTHQREAQLVQIGGSYRGVLMPAGYDADDDRRPDADLHPPADVDIPEHRAPGEAARQRDPADDPGLFDEAGDEPELVDA